ncbi:hypothetical protein DV735_g1937, partial [Chaetothyriales sp. CBS 134920]
MARPRKKRRTHVPKDDNGRAGAGGRPPKSMVIRLGAGAVGANCSQLAQDFRRLMEPDTASRLKERKANKLKDYIAMAGPLGVTHLFLFSRSDSGNTHLRIALTPRGPTLTFRVEKYTLAKDVSKSQKHSHIGSQDHLTAPLLVMNNLTTPVPEGQTQDPIRKQLESLTTTVFQSMFPAISPHSTPLSSIRRVLLLNRETKLQEQENAAYILSLRQYAITTRPAGASKRVRRFDPASQRAHERKSGPLPHLGRLEDAADYLLDPNSAGYMSASETEVDTDAEVEVLQTSTHDVINKKKKAAAEKDKAAGNEGAGAGASSSQPEVDVSKRTVKLSELGPRMQLRLIKIEEGICEGKVLWNEFVKKTKDEEAEIEAKWDQRRKEKEERRAVQRANIERKRKEKEAKKGKSNGKDDENEEGEEEESEWDSDEIEQELERDLEGDDAVDQVGSSSDADSMDAD